ncbi:hypothetical protein BDW22DRAFT_1347418 [Trametopsis cervina]|nr:hypothetical protein BDW22DRAFT_1347418 [Trametopsis cervina]
MREDMVSVTDFGGYGCKTLFHVIDFRYKPSFSLKIKAKHQQKFLNPPPAECEDFYKTLVTMSCSDPRGIPSPLSSSYRGSTPVHNFVLYDYPPYPRVKGVHVRREGDMRCTDLLSSVPVLRPVEDKYSEGLVTVSAGSIYPDLVHEIRLPNQLAPPYAVNITSEIPTSQYIVNLIQLADRDQRIEFVVRWQATTTSHSSYLAPAQLEVDLEFDMTQEAFEAVQWCISGVEITRRDVGRCYI